jgi:hypothetical protein
MRSLGALKKRVMELLAARAEANKQPTTMIVIPDNRRGPQTDEPWPRARRVGQAVIVTYRAQDGKPSPEQLAGLMHSHSLSAASAGGFPTENSATAAKRGGPNCTNTKGT